MPGIKPELNGALSLIDLLPTRPRRPDELFRYLSLIDTDRWCYLDHGSEQYHAIIRPSE